VKRIKQLLHKGIDNLDETEYAELMALLSPEKLAELSEADIAEIKELVKATATDLLDSDDSSDATVQAIEQLANVLDAVKSDEDRRAAEREEAAARKQALRDRIAENDEPVAEEGDEDEAEAEPEKADDEDEDGGEEAPTEEAKEPVVVTASTNTVPAVPRRSPISQRGDAPKPRTSNARRAALTAAAGLPGFQPGVKLDTDDKLFNAFNTAVQLARGSDAAFSMPIVSTRVEIPDELQLSRNVEENATKIDKRSNLAALTASGGACAPVPYNYDLVVVGDDVRPVRDALNRFGAQRGGVALFTPPTITDVMGTGATTSAVSEWTYANDVTPSSPTTKPYLRIACGSDSATTTRVNAIVEQYETGNMMDRWYPELISAYTKLIGTYHARFADAKILAGISALAKAVTHGQVLGSATDIFVALDQLIMGIRFRHRIVQSMPMRVIGFEWVRQSIIADLIRRGDGDRPVEERIKMAQEEINGFFAAHKCNVTWSPDFQFGRTLGQAGGPPVGVQGVGSVIGYPSVARFYVFTEGSVLFLDGGEFKIGVMRDVTKARTNDFVYFSETFENVAYNGVPGELYTYDIDICANGGYASALDIAPCVSNS
jgi:hypothetical protein